MAIASGWGAENIAMPRIRLPGIEVVSRCGAGGLVLGLLLVIPATAQTIYRALPPDSEGRIIFVPIEEGRAGAELQAPSSQKGARKSERHRRRSSAATKTRSRPPTGPAALQSPPAAAKENKAPGKTGTVIAPPQASSPAQSKSTPEPNPESAAEPATGTIAEPAPQAVKPAPAPEAQPGIPPGRKVIDPDHPVEPDTPEE
ncbi:MAG TPA: hypothetical protein VFA53_04430 [Xanthobacteraceae bacterium]|nr:hypothetical protein [Xanthobacteraceae bacterium]